MLRKASAELWPALSHVDQPEVRLNVYRLMYKDNFAAAVWAGMDAVGLGLYHTGVEVHGREFLFGQSGIVCSKPRELLNPAWTFIESIPMGKTALSARQVFETLGGQPGWEGKAYCPLRYNCNDFSEVFCRYLLRGSCPEFPAKLNRAARAACSVLPIKAAITRGRPERG
eukprot:TRINITY_DN11615_c0_g3_i1.p1 TRINITY_DN11615_c0_g3~~TRINITY_DN11615_c0_g3_i1.p1  ORF type:complete len:170 (+),score=44.41 TRINITY_DN11615_c0_g3_i1:170-679(+)